MAKRKKKKMGTPVKYDEPFVLSELRSMLAQLTVDKNIIYKLQLFEKKTYSRQRLSEWVAKFKENEEISNLLQKIDEVLETRAVVNGMTGKLNPTMTIFHLKNNFNWSDERSIKHSGEVGITGFIENMVRKAEEIDHWKGTDRGVVEALK